MSKNNLREDDFVEGMFSAFDWLGKNKMKVISFIVPIIIVVLIVFAYNSHIEAKKFDASEIYSEGLSAFKNENYEQALNAFNKLIEDFSGYAEYDIALFKAAECYKKLGQIDKMNELYDKILNSESDIEKKQSIFILKSNMLYKENKITEAVQELDKAIELAPVAPNTVGIIYSAALYSKEVSDTAGVRNYAQSIINDFSENYAYKSKAETLIKELE